MNNKQYRTYMEEFKLEALELLESSDKSAAQIEQDLGITKGLLLKWRDRPPPLPAALYSSKINLRAKMSIKLLRNSNLE